MKSRVLVRSSSALAVSPDGKTAAFGRYKRGCWRVELRDLASGKVHWCKNGHKAEIKVLTFSPDGTRLVSGGEDNMVRLWDIAAGVVTHELKQSITAQTICFSPDGKRIVVANHGLLESWDPESNVVHQINGATSVSDLVASPTVNAIVLSNRVNGEVSILQL